MAKCDAVTVAPGVTRRDDGWCYYLEGEQEAIIKAGLAKPDWFEDGSRRNKKGYVIRTKNLMVDGRHVETVTRKSSRICTARINCTEEEQREYEAREVERRKQRRPDYWLPSLAKALMARYPGVQVVGALVTELDDGTLQQNIRYQAPLERLRACGLVTDAMLSRVKDGCGSGNTPMGDRYFLCDRLDDLSNPGCLDLLTYTGTVQRERERMSVRDAARILKRFIRRATSKGNHG